MEIEAVKNILKSGDVAGAEICVLTATQFCIRQLKTERIIKEMAG